MGENEIDQALVQRVQNGDKRAFDLLVLKYQHKLTSLISRYIHDWSECRTWPRNPSSAPTARWRTSAATASSIPGCTRSRSTRRRTIWFRPGGGRRPTT